MKYYEHLNEAANRLREIKDELFANPDINRVGVGLDFQHGYFIEAIYNAVTRIGIGENGEDKIVKEYQINKAFGSIAPLEGIDPSDDLSDIEYPDNFPFIQPGLSINSGGTIGAIVQYNNKPHILSCRHVLDSQVTVYLRGVWRNYTIANYIGENTNNALDFGLAEIVDELKLKINEITIHLNNRIRNIITPLLNTPVVKYGPRTGLTEGYIRLVEVYTPCSGSHTYFEVQPFRSTCCVTQSFSEAGDSGSVVVSRIDPSMAIGLHFQAANFHFNEDEYHIGSLSTPIQNLKNELDFNF